MWHVCVIPGLWVISAKHMVSVYEWNYSEALWKSGPSWGDSRMCLQRFMNWKNREISVHLIETFSPSCCKVITLFLIWMRCFCFLGTSYKLQQSGRQTGCSRSSFRTRSDYDGWQKQLFISKHLCWRTFNSSRTLCCSNTGFPTADTLGVWSSGH